MTCRSASRDPSRPLGLISIQINPHYLDADPASHHMGQTREERILQYHEENTTPVLGLREGAMLRVEQGVGEVRGTAGARLFRRNLPPEELPIGFRIKCSAG